MRPERLVAFTVRGRAPFPFILLAEYSAFPLCDVDAVRMAYGPTAEERTVRLGAFKRPDAAGEAAWREAGWEVIHTGPLYVEYGEIQKPENC